MANILATGGGVGMWKAVVKKAFVGNRQILSGRPTIIATAAAPSTKATHVPVGTLAWDEANSDAYICTAEKTGSSNDTWVKINA